MLRGRTEQFEALHDAGVQLTFPIDYPKLSGAHCDPGAFLAKNNISCSLVALGIKRCGIGGWILVVAGYDAGTTEELYIVSLQNIRRDNTRSNNARQLGEGFEKSSRARPLHLGL